MIDLKDLSLNIEKYKESYLKRGLSIDKELKEIIVSHSEYLELLKKEQSLNEGLNVISRKGKKISPEEIKKAKELSSTSKDVHQKLMKKKIELMNKASFLPNLVSKNVKIGKSEKDNKVIFENRVKRKSSGENHWEIMTKKNFWDPSLSSSISGTRFSLYMEDGAKMIKALENYFIEFNTSKGNKYVEVPLFSTKESLYASGHLPKFEDDLYKVSENQYLIPTSETILVNLFKNKTFLKEDLDNPIKYTTLTNCFRKEAGAAGKDTRGIIRTHQFRKAEIVWCGLPKNKKQDLEMIIKHVSDLMDTLELPYRIVQLCSSDLPFSSMETYDIEVWFPGSQSFREVSSISCTGDFQSRRLNVKFKDDKKTNFTYLYNGSSLAIDRIFAAILENNCDSKNNVTIPEILVKFIGKKII